MIMKTNRIIGLLILVITFTVSSCTKTFEKYTENPNQPTSVPAYLLLRQIENNLMVFPAGDEDKFGQYTLSTYTYYGTNEYCLLYTSPSPRDRQKSRMPSSA